MGQIKNIKLHIVTDIKLQHITSNGSLHIMIISKSKILQDNEITVPFDFTLDYYKGVVECACNLQDCQLKKHNEEWKNTTKILNNTDLKSNLMPPLPQLPHESNAAGGIVIAEHENENTTDTDTGGEGEGRHHEGCKLSREDRKLQAYVKQFEKLEKQDTAGKKGKEARTPVLKTGPEENTIVAAHNVKPTPPKKTSRWRKT